MFNMADTNMPLILKHCFRDVKKDDTSENVSAVCIKCSKILKGSFNATTNFLNHIKRKGHADLLSEYEKLKPTIKRKYENDDTDNSKKMKQSTLTNILPKSVNLDKLIVNFIIDTMTPISIVENKSFKALFEGAQQLQRPPKIMCRRTCGNKISEKFEKSKENTKEALKLADFVCTTADIWSSSRRSYLGVTVHWIDGNSLKRQSSALACRRFKGSHTYDKIAELISDIHSEYDLKLSKIVSTVTDNGSNMIKAFKVFGKGEQALDNYEDVETTDNGDDDDLLSVNFPEPTDNLDEYLLPGHERCATHTLHLIAAKDIDHARNQNNPCKKLHDAALAKCHAVWNMCSRSPKACEIYLESTGKSINSPCPTRWNCYYDCIQDILNVQEHQLNEALRKLDLPTFKDNEINYLTEYVSCLKPIAEAIRSLEGDKETFYGCLLPELMRIRKMISFLKHDNPKYCGTLIDVIEKSLNKRFHYQLELDKNTAKNAILAAVSHPFFKLKWVPKEKREYVKELFVSEIQKIKNKERKKSEHQVESVTEIKEKNNSYYMFVEDSDSSETDYTHTTIDLETLQYLKDIDSELYSLNKYPTVKKVFVKYNTICLPSSAPVERLFSFGGMIMRPHRRKMSDDIFEKLVVLKSKVF